MKKKNATQPQHRLAAYQVMGHVFYAIDDESTPGRTVDIRADITHDVMVRMPKTAEPAAPVKKTKTPKSKVSR